MSYIDEILKFNKKFVDSGQYKAFDTTGFPDKKIAVLSCMDTRLTGLLPADIGVYGFMIDPKTGEISKLE